VALATDSVELRLSVRDHGIGLSPEDATRIFERFERAVSVRHFGGLGLGLYICRQIVQAHGGEISAGPAPGGGALFVVRLPKRGLVVPAPSPIDATNDS
jgi:signal transduction histidine kinase